MITDQLTQVIQDALHECGISKPQVTFEHPAELVHGDYATNVAMRYAKELGMNPRELAEKVVETVRRSSTGLDVSDIQVAGPGFINFSLTREFFTKSIRDIPVHGTTFGANERHDGQTVMVEYTDPNLFKEFHIGHVMNNAIGEVVARLYEWNGAKVIRANYQSDVGPNIAKAVWGMKQNRDQKPEDTASLADKVAFLGEAYVHGNAAYDNDETVKSEIDAINASLYHGADAETVGFYKWGHAVSIAHFEEIYKKLGSRFDTYYFESEVFESGQKQVSDALAQGVFEESDGAIVFRGEPYGLHTRVFINSNGLPTYETKEIGLNTRKFKEHQLDESIVVTAEEQKGYFQVVLKAIEQLAPEVADKTVHVTHGMMRTPEGKMSSRKGNVIGGGTLIEDVEARAREKITQSERDLKDADQLAIDEAVAAIKYAILKQTPGKNVMFDVEQSLSLEGDSGPYLQYTYTRCVSLAEQAAERGMSADTSHAPVEPYELERLLYRFPEVVARAFDDQAPQQVAQFVSDIASRFNTLYAAERIVDPDDEYAPYKLALTEAVRTVLENSLSILGIQAPEKM